MTSPTAATQRTPFIREVVCLPAATVESQDARGTVARYTLKLLVQAYKVGPYPSNESPTLGGNQGCKLLVNRGKWQELRLGNTAPLVDPYPRVHFSKFRPPKTESGLMACQMLNFDDECCPVRWIHGEHR